MLRLGGSSRGLRPAVPVGAAISCLRRRRISPL